MGAGTLLGRGSGARPLGGESRAVQGQTEVVQQLLSPVLRRPQLEQVRVLVDELGVHGARQELLVVEHVLQEGDVGLQDRGGGGRHHVARLGKRRPKVPATLGQQSPSATLSPRILG